MCVDNKTQAKLIEFDNLQSKLNKKVKFYLLICS